jgi:Protein of unknown function (DUF1573)
MKTRWLVAAFGSALLIASVAFAQQAGKTTPAPAAPAAKPAAPGLRPTMEVPRLNYDFGETFHLDQYAYAFVVRNKGNADLIIQDVKPGCGCTAAKFDKVIAPGKEGKIQLVVDGNKVHGEFSKAAEVTSNDPDHPNISLSVSGKEIPFVNVVPDGTVYLHGRPGEPIEKELTISSNEKDLDFKVMSVTSNIDDKIKYSYAPGTKKGEYVVKISKNPNLPIMSTYGNLIIHTTSKKAPDTTMQVHVMTKSSILLSPSVLNYGEVKFSDNQGRGTPSTKAVTVTRSAGTLKIKDVSTSNANFTAKLETLTPGQQYKVTVTFNPPTRKTAKQTETGEMVITTDDPQEPTLRVQLVARAM